MTRIAQILQSAIRKIAALALLGAAIFGAVSGIALPVWQRFRDIDERILDQRNLLGRYQSLSSTDSVASSDVNQVVPAAAEQAFLPGETDALRLASLQATLNDVASLSGVRLASASAIDSSEQNGVRLLSLQAQFSTDIEPLQRMLFDLEKKQLNLIVDGLHVVRAPDGGTQNFPSLDVTLTLRGAAPLGTVKQE